MAEGSGAHITSCVVGVYCSGEYDKA